MAMHGHEGSITVGGTTVGAVQNWAYNESADVVEYSSMGDTNKNYATGAVGASGSLSCLLTKADAGQGLLSIGSSVVLALYTEGEEAGDYEVTGTAVVTGVDRGSDKNDMASFSVNFSGVLAEGVVSA
jgi:hypothetical protein